MIIYVLVYDNLKFQFVFWFVLLLLLFFSSSIISIYLSILNEIGGISLQSLGSTFNRKDSSLYLNSSKWVFNNEC